MSLNSEVTQAALRMLPVRDQPASQFVHSVLAVTSKTAPPFCEKFPKIPVF